MNNKKKIAELGFWITILSVVVAIVVLINKYFNLNINIEIIIAISGIICSALVTFGVLKTDKEKTTEDIKDEIAQKSEDYYKDEDKNKNE